MVGTNVRSDRISLYLGADKSRSATIQHWLEQEAERTGRGLEATSVLRPLLRDLAVYGLTVQEAIHALDRFFLGPGETSALQQEPAEGKETAEGRRLSLAIPTGTPAADGIRWWLARQAQVTGRGRESTRCLRPLMARIAETGAPLPVIRMSLALGRFASQAEAERQARRLGYLGARSMVIRQLDPTGATLQYWQRRLRDSGFARARRELQLIAVNIQKYPEAGRAAYYAAIQKIA